MCTFIRSAYAFLHRKKPADGKILFNDTVFHLIDEEIADRPICWSKITEVIAYKIDCFTIDTLCMDILVEKGITVTLNEDMQGFKDFVTKLEQMLPVLPNWRAKVLLPPFQECRTTIFRRTEP